MAKLTSSNSCNDSYKTALYYFDMSKEIGQRIEKELQTRNGGNQSELARYVGVTPQAVQQWISGETSPRGENLKKVAEFLGVSRAFLSYGVIEGKSPKMSTKDVKGTVVEPGPDIKGKVPLISYVQAGKWSETIEFMPDEAIDWLPCPICHSSRTFALRVRGESMYNPHKKPSFEEGDLIFVDPEKQPVNGSLVVVRLENENEATFKKLIIDGEKKYLSALNPAWPEPIIHINSNAKICGVVIFKGEII